MLSPTAKVLLLLVANVVNVLYILSHVRSAFSPQPVLSSKEEYSESLTQSHNVQSVDAVVACSMAWP